jgi:endonuclease/exonuclease/phosphatase family metal-dependent hydrolase
VSLASAEEYVINATQVSETVDLDVSKEPIPLPLRFTVCTYNIRTWTRWPERRDALHQFVRVQRPDVLCVQELQSESQAVLDGALGDSHDRIHDDFEGWTCEGNIYWNRSLFEVVNHGATHVGILEPLRRLFWVRLRARSNGQTFVVATAHFTWSGHAELVVSEKNARIPQARRSMIELDSLAESGEPQLFMGDFNDSNEPISVLRSGGFADCFSALGRNPKATFPASPTASGPEQTIDWLMHRGALRCLGAEVVDYFHGDLSPSDHKPVIATYERY